MNRLPLFWRFQLIGWSLFSFFAFPVRYLLLHNWTEVFLLSLCSDVFSFLTTIGMREIYLRIYRPTMPLRTLALLILGVSILGGFILSVATFASHTACTIEEEKLFPNFIILGVFTFRTWICICWSGLYFGVKLALDGPQQALKLARTEITQKDIELQMLRAQMNTHFLSNALITIQEKLLSSQQALKSLVQAVGNYLNYSLQHNKDNQVTLGEEIAAIRDYIKVEEVRFSKSVKISLFIEDGINHIPIPPMILQPLIENALKYGAKTSFSSLKVELHVFHEGDFLQVDVRNTGKWSSPDKTSHSLGLKNVRRRLALLYPDLNPLTTFASNGWVIIRIRIPILSH